MLDTEEKYEILETIYRSYSSIILRQKIMKPRKRLL
jgi:hypothetical protein